MVVCVSGSGGSYEHASVAGCSLDLITLDKYYEQARPDWDAGTRTVLRAGEGVCRTRSRSIPCLMRSVVRSN